MLHTSNLDIVIFVIFLKFLIIVFFFFLNTLDCTMYEKKYYAVEF